MAKGLFSEVSGAVRRKAEWVKRNQPAWRPPVTGFLTPACLTCGMDAFVFMEPDGACGDEACCPQTSHIEVGCSNPACPVLSERLA